jgi:hypothetical protein
MPAAKEPVTISLTQAAASAFLCDRRIDAYGYLTCRLIDE